MIKLVMCISRKKGMSREEFQRHWLNDHGPHFLEIANAYRAKRYVQSHTITSDLNSTVRSVRGMTREYDGIAEIWWESEADYIAGLSSAELKARGPEFLAAEQEFVDAENSAMFFTVEHELLQRKI